MNRPIRLRVVVLITAAAVLLAAAVGAFVALAVQARAYKETVQQVCADKVAEGGEECTDKQLKGDPGPPGEKGEQGDPGPGPTDAQVYTAVTLYMTGRELVDPADLAAAVADYLAAHPPADGKDAPPITGEQILAQLAVYLTANPPPAGEKGDPGRPPTAEEILAAVADWFAANPGPYCPSGFEPREVDLVTAADGIVHAIVCAAEEP